MSTIPHPRHLLDRYRRWRTEQARIEHAAQAEVDADERGLTARRSRELTLTAAGRQFWAHPSPWVIAAMLVGYAVARVVVGGFHTFDAVLPLVVLAAFPFVEWVIHVFILHFKPFEVAGRRVDPLLAREHRAHHADPRDLPLVFIPTKVYLWLVPALTAVGLLAFGRVGLGLTFLVTTAAIGMVYEWTHYLIHSDYRPRSRAYRAVWRNHRLHHYKNERYWFTVTTAGTADRVLRTSPDPSSVASSPTAKDLLASFERR